MENNFILYLYFLTLSFIFGLIIGSFINCLIYRLHKKKSLWNRSFCPKCKHKISWYDNIPVFSFLFLKAKCRHCKKGISWQYPVVEFVTALLFALAFYVHANNFNFFSIFDSSIIILIRDWFIISVMIVVFLYDLKYYLILDIITLPSIVIVLILNLVIGVEWQNLLISGIIGLSFFLIQFVVSRGKWIGGGDLRLGLLMGVALGWPLVLLAIMLSYISGSFVGVYLLVRNKKKWGSKLPLGVFLSVGTVVVVLWGQKILAWYLALIF